MAKVESIRFNQSTLDRIMQAPAVIEATRQIADQGMRAIQADAPEDSGDYKRGFRLVARKSRYRTVWRIVGTDRKTLLLESRGGFIARAMKRMRSRG